MVGLASVAVLLVFWPFLAHATVYSWREGGVLMMSNSPEDVPENKRASVQSFTSKPAPRRARGEEEAPYTPSVEAAALDAYQRGFERGLEAAEREVAFAERLAASVPQAPAVPIVIEQSAPPTPYYDYPATPYYGAYTPYPSYLLGYYAYGFPARLGRHRRFFHGVRSRGWSFSRAAIGRMR